MNLLLINCPHLGFNDFISPKLNAKVVVRSDGHEYGSVLTDMPLGLISLSAYLKKNLPFEIDIKILDFNIILNEVREFGYKSYRQFFLDYLSSLNYSPDMIGVSCLFSTGYSGLLDLGASLRELYKESILLAGGPVPSGSYREIYRDSNYFDGLCYGEGEKPLLELIDSKDYKSHLRKSTCWITKTKISFASGFQHNIVDELDDIPFYDYDLLDYDKYGLNPAITAYHGVGDKVSSFHFISSLGCPFHCTFCASHKVHGRSMRYWSVPRVKKDLTTLRDKYGAKTIIMQDDHFMGDQERALEIVEIIGELGLRVVFQNGLAMYALSRRFLEALKKAGVEQLLLSIESGSEKTLRLMKKPLKLKIVQRVVDDCRDLKIYTNANILIGMPGETISDIEETREFLKTISPNWFMIFCASPLVGSEMYDESVKNGFLEEGFVNSGDFKNAVLKTKDWSAQQIQSITYLMNLELNFKLNKDMILGEYELALKGFINAIKARPDHALAYYCAAICFWKLNMLDEYLMNKELCLNIVRESEFWSNVFSSFGIQLNSLDFADGFMINEATNNQKNEAHSNVGLHLRNIFGVESV